MRSLTEIEANAIFTTLVGRAGADKSQRAEFIRSFLPPHRQSEYDFRGLLGSGNFIMTQSASRTSIMILRIAMTNGMISSKM